MDSPEFSALVIFGHLVTSAVRAFALHDSRFAVNWKILRIQLVEMVKFTVILAWVSTGAAP